MRAALLAVLALVAPSCAGAPVLVELARVPPPPSDESAPVQADRPAACGEPAGGTRLVASVAALRAATGMPAPRAVVIDVRPQVAADPSYQLTAADVLDWERAHGRVPSGALVLAFTGFQGTGSAPGLHPAAAALLIQRGIGGAGIDTPLVDRAPERACHTRPALLGAGKYLLEGLTHLEALPADGAEIAIAPLAAPSADGIPVRVTARFEP